MKVTLNYPVLPAPADELRTHLAGRQTDFCSRATDMRAMPHAARPIEAGNSMQQILLILAIIVDLQVTAKA
jgi:hypothetical protein